MMLREGKFYNLEGVEVPLEIGNVDQIKLLKKQLALMEREGAKVTTRVREHITYVAEASFECDCGKEHTVKGHDDNETEQEAEDNFDERVNCKCGLSWDVMFDFETKKILAHKDT
jgi:hypothetical protein